MSAEIQRKIVATCRTHRLSVSAEKELQMLILLHPDNLKRLQTEDYEHLINMEKVYNVKLTFRADPSYHMENFRIIVSNH
jgi:ribonuclease G